MSMSILHHIAVICSDKDSALEFYVNILGFPIIRENYREDRDDWKIDLRINETTELELFIIKGILSGRVRRRMGFATWLSV